MAAFSSVRNPNNVPATAQWPHSALEIVQEQVLVLFRAGTMSLQSGLGTFFVPEEDHADHTITTQHIT